MNDAPSFDWWPKDYLSDLNVARMSLAAQGAYVRLICHCWLDDKVPSDADSLARILGVSVEIAEGLRDELAPAFVSDDDGWWANPRVERERKCQRERRENRRSAGRAGADARWRGGNRRNAHPDRNADRSDRKGEDMTEP